MSDLKQDLVPVLCHHSSIWSSLLKQSKCKYIWSIQHLFPFLLLYLHHFIGPFALKDPLLSTYLLDRTKKKDWLQYGKTGQIIINRNRLHLENSFTFHRTGFSPIQCCVRNSSGKKYLPHVWVMRSLLKSDTCSEGNVQTFRITVFKAAPNFYNEKIKSLI